MRLLEAVSGESLISQLSAATHQALSANLVEFQWQLAEDTEAPPDTHRIVCQIPLPEPSFDQLFNGRCGYRAQYYLSPEEGEAFNRRIIDVLEQMLVVPASARLGVPQPAIQRSFKGGYSKIWAFDERRVFDEAAPGMLMPPRWRSYAGRGTRLPLASRLDVKGTFIQPDGTDWVDPLKLTRASDLHERGYT
ncbi:hypothetical protein C7U89_01480 [Bradyrhizobium sp. WBOS4]|nr:hypothetical protein [Bradyrhizobium sp. WBOS8]MDD1581627.1 hypothetical protein [Bradyrhizobium sp. WBOS4]UUO49898.1 hypothetical protein DCM78_25105 [Bradyrhizobium sp. WBOS04]UUO58665.1 hypothetical protein DCM80_05385 [Bradyrhizobium sp. WBOS08]